MTAPDPQTRRVTRRFRINSWVQKQFRAARQSDVPIPLSVTQFDSSAEEGPWDQSEEEVLKTSVCNFGGLRKDRLRDSMTVRPKVQAGRMFSIIELPNQPGLTVYGQLVGETEDSEPYLVLLIGPDDYHDNASR